jgi:O-acetyl-ADP-ribose deacetylase (regulator of RNase III)
VEERQRRKISEIVYTVLRHTDELELETVCFPPLGCGILKVPSHVFAKGFLAGMTKFAKDNRNHRIKKIIVCIYDKKGYDKFNVAWEAQGEEEAKEISSDSDSIKPNKKGNFSKIIFIHLILKT